MFLALVIASLLLVHANAYEPAVSYVLLYLAASVGVVAAAVVVPLLPTEQFTSGFCGAVYALYAAVVAMMVFFTGGVSSELYVILFPLLMVAAVHGSWRIVLAALVAVLFCYALAMMPGLLEGGEPVAAPVFYRFAALALTGAYLVFAARGVLAAGEAGEYASEEGGSILLERVEEALAARKGVQVSVVLVDPGTEIEDLDLLLDRVWSRIGEPIPLGEGNLFGMVVSGTDDRGAESAARRALAAAGSLGASDTRAGVAIYPRDARSAEDLLVAAGQALEAAFEVESPSAIVLASRGHQGEAGPYRAAR